MFHVNVSDFSNKCYVTRSLQFYVKVSPLKVILFAVRWLLINVMMLIGFEQILSAPELEGYLNCTCLIFTCVVVDRSRHELRIDTQTAHLQH